MSPGRCPDSLMNTPQHTSGSVYRSMSFDTPDPTSDTMLVEVIVTWGDEVLSVSHLRANQRFEHPGLGNTRVEVEGGRCVVVVSPEATVWLRRRGEFQSQRTSDAGHAITLEVGMSVLAVHDNVAIAVRRVEVSDVLPSVRRVTGFGVSVACSLILATTGVAWTKTLAQPDDVIVRDDSAQRRWLTAHVQASLKDEPAEAVAAQSRQQPDASNRVWHGGIIAYNFCLCSQSHQLSPFNTTDDNTFIDTVFGDILSQRYTSWPLLLPPLLINGPMHEADVRRTIRRQRANIMHCYKRNGGTSLRTHSSERVRFVVGSSGDVSAAALVSAAPGNEHIAACLTTAIRRWHFSPHAAGVSVVDALFGSR
jgi:hypothetical protein